MAHFTREEIEEIRIRLSATAVKDSQFVVATDLEGDVHIAILQDNKNKIVLLDDIADRVFELTSDQLNTIIAARIAAARVLIRAEYMDEIAKMGGELHTEIVVSSDEVKAELDDKIEKTAGDLQHQFNTEISQTAEEISLRAHEELVNTAGDLRQDYDSKISITAREIRSDVDKQIEDTSAGLEQEFHSIISQTAEEIRSDVDKRISDTQDELESEFHSEISQTAEQIHTEVTREISDSSGNVLEQSRSYTDQTADRIAQGVETAIDDSETKTRTEFRSELEQTAKAITATVDETRRELDGTRTEMEGKFTVQADLIASKVSQVDYDEDNVVREERYSQIEQTAEAIQAEVVDNKRTADGQAEELRSSLEMTANNITAQVEANKTDADGKLSQMHSELDITAEHIATKVSKTDYDEDNTVRDQRFSSIEQTAEQIQSTVEHNSQVDDERYLEQQSQITQQAGLIATKVSETEYDSDKVLTNARMSAIEQTSEQIQLQVTENRQIEDGHYQSTQSQITEQAGQIALKVSQDEFDAYEGQVSNKFSQIEQTEAGITATVEQHTSQLSTQAGTLTEYYNWLSSLQTQVDQEIDTWFENYPPVTVDSHGVPTSTTPLMVSPYSDWYNAETPDDPEAVRERHVEDVFYDNSTGYGFRFSATGNKGSRVYEWVLITDSAVIAALAAAAAAQAAADGKIRAFLATPTAPYSYGDLWIKDVKLYPGTASEVTLKQTFTCSRAEGRAEGTVITPEMLAADWEPVEDYAIEVAKANIQILANATINYATQFTYNADGTISDTTSGAITTAAGQIRLQVANGAIDTAVGPNGKITTPLLGTGIDIVNGEITLIANKISLKNQNDITGLALTTIGTSPNQKVVIDVSSLNVAGIFTTSNWTTIATNIDNAAQGYAGTAESNAESYADTAAGNALSSAQTYADNAVDYFNQNVFTPLATTVGGMETELTVLNGYRTAMLDNMTLITGGLVLSTLIELGSGTPGQSGWEVHAGISGIYDNTAGHGGGIAAWYGGPRVDHEVSPSTTPYAKSLFRMDGSGYLAGGEISWGSSGSVTIHGATLYDGQDTISIAQLIELYSWFEKVSFTDSQGNTRYALKLVTGTDTNLAGFCTDGFITAGGVGTGGGGGGDATMADVWRSLTNNPQLVPTDITGTTPINALHIPIGSGLSIDSDGNIIVTAQGTVTGVALGSGTTPYSPVNGIITLPAYPTALASPYALTVGSKTYDGSAAVIIDKSDIGLGNVTNDAQVKRAEMGAASGVATLGSDGKVPSSQLPSYVDDVLEYADLAHFPATGESGKIYVALDTNKTYRWSGTAYVEISPSIVIGTTTGTAFDGGSGYSHVTNGDIHVTATQKTNWNTAYTNSHTHSNKSVLDGISSTQVTNWDAVFGYFNNGVIGSSHLPSMYIGTTGVQFSSAAQALTGITTINASGAITLSGTSNTTKRIYFGDTDHYVELINIAASGQTANWVFHFSHGLYSDGFVTAGGVGSGGGGGGGLVQQIFRIGDFGGVFDTSANDTFNAYAINSLYTSIQSLSTAVGSKVDRAAMWASLQNNDIVSTYDNYKIAVSHIPDLSGTYLPLSGGSSYPMTGTIYGNTGYGLIVQSQNNTNWGQGIRVYPNPSSGTALLSLQDSTSDNLFAIVTNVSNHKTYFDVKVSGTRYVIHMPHADGTLALTSDIPSLSNYVTLTTAQTISGAKTFTGNADNGNATFKIVGTQTGSLGWNYTLSSLVALDGDNRNVFQLGKASSEYNSSLIYHYQVADGSTSNRLSFGLYGPDSILHVVGTGRVGIKTTSPDYVLEVNGTFNSTTIYQNGVALGARAFDSTSYLPLSGGNIDSTSQLPLTLNSTTSHSMLQFKVGDVAKAYVGYYRTIGAFLQSSEAPGNPLVNIASDGVFKYNDTYPFYHSGNSNLTTVPWSASSLTLAGSISGATNIDSLLYFDTTNATVAANSVLNPYLALVIGHFGYNHTYLNFSPGGTTAFQFDGFSQLNINRLYNGNWYCPMTILNSGSAEYIGINNSTPQYTLDVNGSIHSTSLTLAGAISGATSISASGAILTSDWFTNVVYGDWTFAGLGADKGIKVFSSANGSYSQQPNPFSVGIQISGYYSLWLACYGGGDSTNLWWRNNGNTWREIYHSGNSNLSTVPWSASSLTLNGAISGATTVSLGSTSTDNHYINIFSSYNNSTKIYYLQSYQGKFRIYQGNGNDTSGLVIDSSNNFGIGTPSPSYKLDVSGVIHATTGIFSDGYVTAGTASDIRLKENVNTLNREDAKRIVMGLRPVTFSWNSLANGLCEKYEGDDIGFIAQEVQLLVPQAIGIIFNDYLRMDPTKFIAPLVSIAQSHESRLDAAERKIREQDNRIASLEAENAQLKARLT